jgi:hypothetical protein
VHCDHKGYNNYREKTEAWFCGSLNFVNLKCQVVEMCKSCLFQPVGKLSCKINATLETAGIQYCLIEATNG